MREEFIAKLQEKNVALDPRVAEAFRAIERKDFMLEGSAEIDRPFHIGEGQTISQPYTVAFMLDRLEVKPGMKVLDIGSGSGWTTALLAHMVGKTGKVIGTELKEELVQFGRENLKKYGFAQAEIKEAEKGTYGYPEEKPYDRILVSAAAKDKMPQSILDQLAENGMLVGPVDDRIEKITKDRKEVWAGFAFVPLLGEES